MTKLVPFRTGLKPIDAVEIQSLKCNDLQASKYFVEMAGSYVRWVPDLGWLIWNGHKWLIDAAGDLNQMAEQVGQRFRELAVEFDNPKIAEYLFRWAKQCESSRGISNFLELSKHRLYAKIEDFDAHPLHVNFPNSLLSFDGLDKESELPNFTAHNSAMNITKEMATPWTMGAPASRWLAFLEEVLPNAEVRDFVQRAAGYSILGTTREQVFLVLHGAGCNGKSTFLSVLLKVMGPDYAIQCAAETFMQQRNDRIRADLARLRGLRFVSAIETAENRRLDEALVKACTGGDPIVAEHKFKAPFQFYPGFTLWLATNHKPRVHDTSHAMWRRIRLVPFDVVIPEDRRDPDLEEKLLCEREGIMDWIVTGAVHYMRDGLKAPDAVTAAGEKYRIEEDVLGQFLDDRCIIESVAQVSRNDLYAAYHEWCDKNGERSVGQRQFSHLCQEKGFDSYKSNGVRSWLGVRIKP